MLLPQNIPINITPENVWAVLDAVKTDFKDHLAEVMQDSKTDLMVENEQKEDDKDEDQEADTFISDTNQCLHVAVHDNNDTDVQDEKINKSTMLWAVLLKVKIILWKKFIGISLQGK